MTSAARPRWAQPEAGGDGPVAPRDDPRPSPPNRGRRARPEPPRTRGVFDLLGGRPVPFRHAGGVCLRKGRGTSGRRGTAILAFDVPDNIIALAVDEYFPLSQGLVQFDDG